MEIPLLPHTTYHIYTHANGNECLFRSEENYLYFLKKYGEHIYPVAETYAYCMMPNHLHLAVKIRSEEELLQHQRLGLTGFENLSGLISQQFSNLFNAYTKAYNKRYNRRGSLFTRPFKRKAVESDRYFTELIVYIHNNPVHHGFVKNLLDWPHSSIHAYIWDKPSKLNRQHLLDWVGDKQQLLLLHNQTDFRHDLFDL
jgi:REP element-mobilizing transposase RayT